MSPLGKPTNKDLDTYPHVLLTGPHKWDPSLLDYTHPQSGGDPVWTRVPSDHEKHDPCIDYFSNFKGKVVQNLSVLSDTSLLCGNLNQVR